MHTPWTWSSVTVVTMVVDDSVAEFTSKQVTIVPLWLSLTVEICNFDDTGLFSEELLVKIYVVELSNTRSVCASAEPLAAMPCVNGLKLSIIRGKCHSSTLPVMLHVNSRLSPTHTWAVCEGDSITAPETRLSQSRFKIFNEHFYLVHRVHNCIAIAGPSKCWAKQIGNSFSVDSIYREMAFLVHGLQDSHNKYYA